MLISEKGTLCVMNFSTSSSFSKNHKLIQSETCYKVDVTMKALTEESILQSYLPHVHFDDIGKIGARLVVTEEGSLQSLLVQALFGW